MEIEISPEQQKAIEGLAAQNHTSPAEQARRLLSDALERAADYDRWFREKVEEGLEAAGRGELVDHEDVVRMINQRYRD